MPYPDVCNRPCCEQLPCEGPALDCDSISAANTKSGCGFEYDGRKWLTRTTVFGTKKIEAWIFDGVVCSGPVTTYESTTDSPGTTYSDEFVPETTASLIARTVADLPAYPETWGEPPYSFRNLSPGETSYFITRIKWRLQHAPTGTCYLKVWLQTRFVPEDGGDPVIEALPTYLWEQTGNPCFTDDTFGPGAAENLIRSEISELEQPSADGTTYVDIVKFSCLASYTPPDDGSANGYPPAPTE